MSRIFLSHSSKDNFEALALSAFLTEHGWNDIFLDLDPDRGIAAGERWERALHAAARRCEAVIFLISGHWLASGWCLKEYALARTLNKKLFAVIIDPEKTLADLPPELAGTWQAVNLMSGQDGRIFRVPMPGSHEEKHVTFSMEGLRRLKNGLEKAGLDPKFFSWPPEDDKKRSPYRGLKPLESADAGIFFGRDAPIIEALDRFRGLREAAAPRLLAILGASGAGKSSFLRAGLLPRLMRDDANFLPFPPLRPERAALYGENGLLRALEKMFPDRARAALREAIRAGAEGLRPLLAELVQTAFTQTLADAVSSKPPLILIAIDQAEELFFTDGLEEGMALLSLLRDLAALDAPAIAVLFVIRTDAYDSLERAQPLEDMPQNTLPLQPMPRGAYIEVIEGPARRFVAAGGKLAIEPQLTQVMLEDLERGGGSDPLPLLAFTLEQLYLEYGQTGALRLADYRSFGGLRGSIDKAVARAFARADTDPRIPRDPKSREILLRRGLIPWLAGIDPDTKSPRRNIARRDDIPEEARPLIDLLVEERLLSTDSILEKDPSGKDVRISTIEPAHEALLRQWGLLEDWLAEDLPVLATLESVKRAARDWNANARSQAWLAHQGQRLSEAQALDARPDIAARLDTIDRAYLSQCRTREEEIRAEEEARRREREEEQARRLADAEKLAAANKRIARRTGAGLVAALILAVAAAIFGIEAFRERQVAQGETDRANATRADAAEVARLARNKLTETNSTLADRIDDVIDWTPPAWRSFLNKQRAGTYATAGDFNKERSEIDKALRIEPDLVPLLTSSANNFLTIGDADGAVRDAKKAIDKGATEAVVYGNLILGEAMQRNYGDAISHIDFALNHSQRTIGDTEHIGAEDLQEFTSSFELNVEDTDFLIALGYIKAACLAMSGTGHFGSALDEADRADRDHPFSRTVYLAALNWEWQILRGQAMREAHMAQGETLPISPDQPIRDYGAYAFEGALWARIAATRNEYAERATRAFTKFQNAYKAAPRDDYRELAGWVDQALRKPIERVSEPNSPLANARDLQMRAKELHNGPNSGNVPWRMAPAVKLLTDAIHLLDPQRLGRPIGRREEDTFTDLLLLRASWRLTGKDYAGAAQDAQRVLEIDPQHADAHRLLGDASIVDADKQREYETAIKLDPSNTDALDGLVSIIEVADPKQAIHLLERKHVFVRFYSGSFSKLAKLQDQAGLSKEALQNIDNAINWAPWSFDSYSARHDYEIHAGLKPSFADLHNVQGLHELAEFRVRNGADDIALRAYTDAFRKAAALPKSSPVTLELQSLMKDFSAFLVKRFGLSVAEQWWQSFATNPLATAYEKELSVKEGQRIATE